METIAHIENDFTSKFGIPRQSGIANSMESTIVFEPPFRNADTLRGLDDFSHIWLIWHFSENGNQWSPTVRPPRLGGNTRKGVFATRSPFRPNPIGLSCVKIVKIDYNTTRGPVIVVRGADLMNGTPIFDIKPYLPYTDRVDNAKSGFAPQATSSSLNVNISKELQQQIKKHLLPGLIEMLSNDPRPQYHNNPNRTYHMAFADKEIHFKVDGNNLEVTEITQSKA